MPITDTTSIAIINPLRYRGYYYDSETGMYYLQSRYYDPSVGRFINADSTDVLAVEQGSIVQYNLFAYALNNPIVKMDDNGECAQIIIGAEVGAIVGVTGQIISDAITSKLSDTKFQFSNWQTYVGAAAGGAVSGAILGATGNVALANFASGAVTTGVGLTLEKITHEKDISFLEVAGHSVIDGSVSFILGEIPEIAKISKGKNNYSAVYKSGLTKLRNKTASRMSAKVISKGLASTFTSGLYLDAYYGIKQYHYNNYQKNNNKMFIQRFSV